MNLKREGIWIVKQRNYLDISGSGQKVTNPAGNKPPDPNHIITTHFMAKYQRPARLRYN